MWCVIFAPMMVHAPSLQHKAIGAVVQGARVPSLMQGPLFCVDKPSRQVQKSASLNVFSKGRERSFFNHRLFWAILKSYLSDVAVLMSIYGDYTGVTGAPLPAPRSTINCNICTWRDMQNFNAGTAPWGRERTLLYCAAGLLLLGHWQRVLWALSSLSLSQLSTIAAAACASAAIWTYVAAHIKGWTRRAQEAWYQV